jgi:CO/xanthine dehydrogenase Mo-binding subunit
MVVGKLLENAAEKLKESWNEKDTLIIEECYKYPEECIWDGDSFTGDAYASYSWGANVVEVEVDPVTYESKICGVWAVFDIGNPIDERIVQAQIEGGILQGLGYGGIEVVENHGGRFRQRTSTDCIIPTSEDAPAIQSELICEPYSGGPYGAKGLGELTLIGAPSAYALAVEDATCVRIHKIPVRPEYLLEVMEGGQ